MAESKIAESKMAKYKMAESMMESQDEESKSLEIFNFRLKILFNKGEGEDLVLIGLKKKILVGSIEALFLSPTLPFLQQHILIFKFTDKMEKALK